MRSTKGKNKQSEFVYSTGLGNIEFFGADDAAKVRGPRRDIMNKWLCPIEEGVFKKMKIKVTKLTCKRCNYTWTPRGPEVTQCPACKSPYWNKARKDSK